MRALPISIQQANDLVAKLHRHHKPVCGHKFSIGCAVNGRLVGAVIVSRPVSREIDFMAVAEVSRLVTDGTPNACSFLYAAAARAAKAMGYSKIQTYILDAESGSSLKATGWEFEAMTGGGDWNNSKANKGRRRTDQPQCPKQRWSKWLNQ